MHIISREQLAWAGGVVCGEGNIRMNRPLPRGAVTRQMMPCLQVGQYDHVEILIRLEEALGMGTVRGPYKERIYSFSIYGYQRVQAAIAMMWPWLTEVKKEQARQVLLEFQGRKP